MKYKAIIFDWDGTLMDSTTRIVESMQCAAQEFDLPFRSEFEVKQIIGLGLPEAIVALWPELELDKSTVKSVARQYSVHFLAEERSEMALFEHALELFDVIKSLNLRLAVATGKGRVGLNRHFAQFKLAHVFDDSRCADETRSKPHPLMLHELSKSLNVETDNMLMVGDTQFDLDMAHNAGVDSVAITHGAHALDKLKKSNPIHIVDDLKQLTDWIHLQAKSI
ncbi:HAD-IA family hydrolase [Oceaniserpentilla sp. 4NH20-0058]|uniref:HAD-IA family hydrolase n=1 Tax=Oceaniserpentilla sp. 4NH20-0058 TaxID=3127660 RepID=UPI0031078D23